MDKAPIAVVSSMATRAVLAELARAYELRAGRSVQVESVGGVDAKRRVLAGEPFDAVVLSRDALDELFAAGRLVRGSRIDLARSGVAVAVRAGAPRPEIGSEEALKGAVLAARSVGISTGPSGVALAALFERWGVASELRDRVVIPPPGVAVGALLARGDVELGFQQWSELVSVEGIEVLGPLPAGVQIVTVFSGAVGAQSAEPESARALLEFMASREADGAKRSRGLEPA